MAVEFFVQVRVTGSPQLALTIGDQTRQATLTDYTNPRETLFFAYTVQAADMDADGISIVANALNLNGGTIVADAPDATAADLTHLAVAADPTRKVDGRIVAAPAVEDRWLYNSPANCATYGLGETIEVLFEFSRNVTVTGSPQLALTIGDQTRQATYERPFAQGKYLLFTYTVVAADSDTAGISVAADALNLDNGRSIVAVDADATPADLTHDAVDDDATRKVDGRLAVPAKPTGFMATAGNTQVTLSWDDPSNDEITTYQIRQWTTTEPATWTDITNSGASTTSHPVTGLTNGTAYRFRIRAVATSVPGAVSDVATATPIETAPGKVTGLTATVVSQAQIDLSWDATATATQYQYRSGTTSGSLGSWRADQTGTTASLTGLNANTTYYVQVRAGNAGGYGTPSDEVGATTLPAVPAKPTNFTATAGDAQVTLRWDDPSDSSITEVRGQAADRDRTQSRHVE